MQIYISPQNDDHTTACKTDIKFCEIPYLKNGPLDQTDKSHYRDLLASLKPICWIFCASPGSYACEKQLADFVQLCIDEVVLPCLVCTNMWGGNNRLRILKTFEKMMNDHSRIQLSESVDWRKTFVVNFHKGLVARVNSSKYEDTLLKCEKEVAGVDELLEEISRTSQKRNFSQWVLMRKNDKTVAVTKIRTIKSPETTSNGSGSRFDSSRGNLLCASNQDPISGVMGKCDDRNFGKGQKFQSSNQPLGYSRSKPRDNFIIKFESNIVNISEASGSAENLLRYTKHEDARNSDEPHLKVLNSTYSFSETLYGYLQSRLTLPTPRMLFHLFHNICQKMANEPSLKARKLNGQLNCHNVQLKWSNNTNKVESMDFEIHLFTCSECSNRYIAPELLLDSVSATDSNSYVEASNVYSMGILMWQAYSRGQEPWVLYRNENRVRDVILSDSKLSLPDACEDDIWDQISLCMSIRPGERPTFQDLQKFFECRLKQIPPISIRSPKQATIDAITSLKKQFKEFFSKHYDSCEDGVSESVTIKMFTNRQNHRVFLNLGPVDDLEKIRLEREAMDNDEFFPHLAEQWNEYQQGGNIIEVFEKNKHILCWQFLLYQIAMRGTSLFSCWELLLAIVERRLAKRDYEMEISWLYQMVS
ncbi:unnamed protein product [Rotaria socialis]|uniref:Protein kinase domain-containing protein n=1 Tax=Rotaria socialis TaxID=392032 RepID=A0A818V1H5_9BILA|nr:unnamed protein product [Rotaria socialis]